MKDFKKNIKTLIFGLFLTLIIAGCKSDGEEIEQPEKIYYDQAQARMSSGNYFGAIESLEAIDTRYPFGKYAEQAQIELIYAHFMNTETEAAHSAAEKFIRLHPRHPNIDYAYFMKGMTGYYQDEGLLNDIFALDLSKRDTSPAMQSYADLTEFIIRYPESEYIDAARERLIFLRNLIASSELDGAEYYIKRGAYLAAVNRANYVLKNIPNSTERERALRILKEAYKQLGYDEYAEKISSFEAN